MQVNSRKRSLNERTNFECSKRPCYTPSTYSSDSESEDSPSGITGRVSGFFKNTILESRIYKQLSNMFNNSWLNRSRNEESHIENSYSEGDENATHLSKSLKDFRHNSSTKIPSRYLYQGQHSKSMVEEGTTNAPKLKLYPFSLSPHNPFLERSSLSSTRELKLNSATSSKKNECTKTFLPVPVVKSKTKTQKKKLFKSNSIISKQSKPQLNGHGSLLLNKSRSYLNKYASTARQSIRLEEREHYKQLIQQYTAVQLNGNANSTLKSSQNSFSFPSENRINHTRDASVKCSDSPSPVFRTVLTHDSSTQLRHRLLSLSEAANRHHNPKHFSEARSDKTPIIIEVESSSAFSKSQSDADVQIIKEHKKLSNVPVISSKDKLKAKKRDCVFLSSEWTQDLKKELERKSLELQPLIENAKTKTAAFEQARENHSELYREKIRQSIEKIHRFSFHEIEEIKSKPEKKNFIELTDEMEIAIDKALVPTPPDQLLADGFNLTIRRRDIETLSKLNWLNDEIIYFYLNLLVNRGKQDDYPSVYAFNTFFYPKLMSSGHSALKRWTRKVDIFSYHFIVIPVHLGMHWCLALIDFKKKEIRYYDSLLNDNNDCLNALKVYLCDESLDKKKMEFDSSDWSLKTVKDIPQQMNGSDCGMFACIYAEYITREAEITFSQEDMPYFRRRMVYEILKKELL